LAALRGKSTDAETRLGRLHAAIENGIAGQHDRTLKERLAAGTGYCPGSLRVGDAPKLERLVTGGGAAPAGVPSFIRTWLKSKWKRFPGALRKSSLINGFAKIIKLSLMKQPAFLSRVSTQVL
jgi:hypothetical protein